MQLSRTMRAVVAGTAVLAIAACDVPMVSAPPPLPEVPAAPAPQTPQSAAAQAYYAQVQQTLLSQGLLRTDAGTDVPYTDRMLAESFIRVAMFDEYRRTPGGFVRGETEGRLRKWAGPVRVAVRFGASVPAERQATDRARIASYLSRLSVTTGHPISLVDNAPNFWLHILSEDEREALGPEVRATLPGLRPGDIAGITQMPRTTYCLVYALSEGPAGGYTRAVGVVRAEHPDLLRLSCIHEEIAQGLGLPNDYPRARPSIFNDDEEFALLTDHDELLLRILYSPELRPGMTVDEARPIVEMLATRLIGGGA